MFMHLRQGGGTPPHGQASRSDDGRFPDRAAKARQRHTLRRSWAVALLVASVIPVALRAAGPGDPAADTFSSVFKGVKLVRCLFLEQRVVVRSAKGLTVLHPGDELPEAGLRLRDADATHIMFETIATRTMASGVSLPEAIVVLSPAEDGGVTARIFRATPPADAAPRLGVVAGGTARQAEVHTIERASGPTQQPGSGGSH